MTMQTECGEWAVESFSECAAWETTQTASCTAWDTACCTWWPCSMACSALTMLCRTWVWVSDLVCSLWTTVWTLVCILWEIVTILLTPISWLLKLIESIPIFGRALNQLRNILTSIFWRVVGLGDTILGLAGFQPLKKLRLCIIILRDENGVPVTTEAALAPAIANAEAIFRSAANTHVIVENIVTAPDPSHAALLDVRCNAGSWLDDFGVVGVTYNWLATTLCTGATTSKLTGYASTITVFCVRDVAGAQGCTMGLATGYITLEGANSTCLAHEIGHMVGLWHCCGGLNLANGACGGFLLNWWQEAIVRNSKFITYV